MRRTKIVATLGPASNDAKIIERLIESGVNVFRLNFSHGTHEQHQKALETVRGTAKRLGQPIACLQDLSGPRIRTGDVSDKNGILLEEGASFTLTTEKTVGTTERVSTTYRHLPQDVQPGKRILLDDGLIELEVEAISGGDVKTKVVSGGRLKSKKGINLPGVRLSVPSLTQKDRDDLAFGLSLDVGLRGAVFRQKQGGCRGASQPPARTRPRRHAGHRKDRETGRGRQSIRHP